MSYKLNIYNGSIWENVLKDLYIQLDNTNWSSDNLHSFLDELKTALNAKESRNVVKTFLDYNASPFDVILVDTTSDVVTITLPASPAQGDRIQIIDVNGNADVNKIFINRNGHNLNGQSININMDISFSSITLVYDNITNGWYYNIPVVYGGSEGTSMSDLKKFSKI